MAHHLHEFHLVPYLSLFCRVVLCGSSTSANRSLDEGAAALWSLVRRAVAAAMPKFKILSFWSTLAALFARYLSASNIGAEVAGDLVGITWRSWRKVLALPTPIDRPLVFSSFFSSSRNLRFLSFSSWVGLWSVEKCHILFILSIFTHKRWNKESSGDCVQQYVRPQRETRVGVTIW